MDDVLWGLSLWTKELLMCGYVPSLSLCNLASSGLASCSLFFAIMAFSPPSPLSDRVEDSLASEARSNPGECIAGHPQGGQRSRKCHDCNRRPSRNRRQGRLSYGRRDHAIGEVGYAAHRVYKAIFDSRDATKISLPDLSLKTLYDIVESFHTEGSLPNDDFPHRVIALRPRSESG